MVIQKAALMRMFFCAWNLNLKQFVFWSTGFGKDEYNSKWFVGSFHIEWSFRQCQDWRLHQARKNRRRNLRCRLQRKKQEKWRNCNFITLELSIHYSGDLNSKLLLNSGNIWIANFYLFVIQMPGTRRPLKAPPANPRT